MILKIFLEMEWMLILGGDLGLYVYFVVVVGARLFGLKNCKANSDYAFLRFLSSVLFLRRSAVRILSFRAAIRSMTWPASGRLGAGESAGNLIVTLRHDNRNRGGPFLCCARISTATGDDDVNFQTH